MNWKQLVVTGLMMTVGLGVSASDWSDAAFDSRSEAWQLNERYAVSSRDVRIPVTQVPYLDLVGTEQGATDLVRYLREYIIAGSYAPLDVLPESMWAEIFADGSAYRIAGVKDGDTVVADVMVLRVLLDDLDLYAGTNVWRTMFQPNETESVRSYLEGRYGDIDMMEKRATQAMRTQMKKDEITFYREMAKAAQTQQVLAQAFPLTDLSADLRYLEGMRRITSGLESPVYRASMSWIEKPVYVSTGQVAPIYIELGSELFSDGEYVYGVYVHSQEPATHPFGVHGYE